MKIGPKYKIARRLGAPVFEKTQNQKFALREERKNKSKKRGKRPSQKTDYGLQMTEKQKARMFYAVSEKQFKNYVTDSLNKKGVAPAQELYSRLESRLDNVVWRLGLAPTHLAARQAVSHGHIVINGKKSKTPSTQVKEGDIITIREGSKQSAMFKDFIENTPKAFPSWIDCDKKNLKFTIKAKPISEQNDMLFDLGQVVEFYQR